MQAEKKILIAAGGTGGHIFPAVHIAECIKHINPNVTVEFVHTGGVIEKHIYSQYPFKCHKLFISRLNKNVPLKERIKTLFLLPLVFLNAIRIILKTKPHLIFGTGGAVSGPLLLAGVMLKTKAVILEPNIVPGLTNRYLSRFVNKVIVVWSQTKKMIKAKHIVQKGFPVRLDITKVHIKTTCKKPYHILVLGGSQGAEFINKVVHQVIQLVKQKSDTNTYHFVHQTGEKQFLHYKKLYEGEKNVQVYSFLEKIHQFYAWADIVISRAGMGVIAELSATGKPSILIPLSTSANNHQFKNAKALQQQSGSILIEQKNCTAQVLTQQIKMLVSQAGYMQKLATNIHQLKIGESGKSIADYLLSCEW